MRLKEKNGIKMDANQYLNGDWIITVYGIGVEKLRFVGYQNQANAERYFEKCVKERGEQNG